jgi:hypothetical protein
MTDSERNKFYHESIEKLIFSSKATSEKYVYYILAITAASVAFSVNLTKDSSLNIIQIPLGLAILCWANSFYSGLQQIQKFERLADLNIIQLKCSIMKISFTQKQHNELESIQLLQSKYRKNQNMYLILGFIMFIAWHVVKMYNYK